MAGKGWESPATIAFSSTQMLGYWICKALVAKGLLSPSEAAAALTATANSVRDGTEDGANAGLGEAVAKGYEQTAAWLLGQKGTDMLKGDR